ncbi:CCHC-type domain-containing protein [Trichonephila clavipes]|nr:CCHC-type domain-containing protein [Trichonephila clavipes]
MRGVTITSNVDNRDNLRRSPRLRGLSPEFGLLKENSRKRSKMLTEQEAMPAVVTPSLQQLRSPSTFRGAPGESPLEWLKLTDETDLVSLIRTIVREEVHQLGNQTQESLDSDPKSLEEDVQDEVERVFAPVSAKPTETRPRPTYATVTRKSRAPVQRFSPHPRKTDVWRTADNRPVCFHCGRPGHAMRYCRERKAVFDNYRNHRQNDDVDTEEEIHRDQTPFAFLHQVPRETGPQYAVSDPRRHIAYPVSHQAVKGRKTRESDLPRR